MANSSEIKERIKKLKKERPELFLNTSPTGHYSADTARTQAKSRVEASRHSQNRLRALAEERAYIESRAQQRRENAGGAAEALQQRLGIARGEYTPLGVSQKQRTLRQTADGAALRYAAYQQDAANHTEEKRAVAAQDNIRKQQRHEALSSSMKSRAGSADGAPLGIAQQQGPIQEVDREIRSYASAQKARQSRIDQLNRRLEDVDSDRNAMGAAEYIQMEEAANREIAHLTQQKKQAERDFRQSRYQKLTGARDFEQLAEQGSRKVGNAVAGNKVRDNVYGQMTGDETAIYNYLYATDEGRAKEYMDFLMPQLRERVSDQMADSFARTAKKHPVLSSAVSSALTPLEGLGYVETALGAITGNEALRNGAGSMAIRVKNSIREQVGGDINKSLGGGFAGEVGQNLYGVGASLLDMGVSTLLGGGGKGTLAIMGTSAAGNTTQEALERGASQGQALTLGFLAGAAETLFEKISLDDLIRISSPAARRSVIKNTLRSAGVEASEELFTGVANLITDELVMGEDSQYRTAVRQYEKRGMDPAEARKKAAGDMARQLAWDALGGALSGGIMGGTAEAAGTVSAANLGRRINSEGLSDALIDAAMERTKYSDASAARRLAEEMTAGAQKKTDGNIGRLAAAMEEEGADLTFLKRTEQGTAETQEPVREEEVAAQGDLQDEEDTSRAASGIKAYWNDNGSNADVVGIEEVKDGDVKLKLADGSTASVDDVTFEDDAADMLYDYARVHDTQTARVLVTHYDGSMPVGEYAHAFTAVYGAAKKGKTQAQARTASPYSSGMSRIAFEAAYAAGMNAADAEDMKFSIRETEDGIKYVETDRKVLKGNNPKAWAGQVTAYINKQIRKGGDVAFYGEDGEALTITRKTAGKAQFRNMVRDTTGNLREMTGSEYAQKLRAETHIDEAAQVSTGDGKIYPDTKKHPFARDGFTYRTAYMKDGGKFYKITFSVGKNGEINTIYNIGKIEKAAYGNRGRTASVGLHEPQGISELSAARKPINETETLPKAADYAASDMSGRTEKGAQRPEGTAPPPVFDQRTPKVRRSRDVPPEAAETSVTQPTNKVKGGLERDYAKNAFSGESAEALRQGRRQLKLVDAMARKYGVRVVLVDTLKGREIGGRRIEQDANALYDPETGDVYLSATAQEGAFAYITMHEMVHHIRIRNEAGYETLKSTIMESLEEKGEDIEALIRYQMEKFGYEREAAEEEVICNSAPAILADKSFVEKLAEASRDLAEQIRKFIRQVMHELGKALQRLTGSESWKQLDPLSRDLEQLRKIEAAFDAAMEGAKGAAASASPIRYSAEDVPMSAEQLEAYGEYVDNALAGEGNNKHKDFRMFPVSEELIERLQQAGAEVNPRALHVITDNDIRHIRNSHGIAKEGSYGITTGDLKAIPYILTHADSVYYIPEAKSVLYVLDHVDATYYVENFEITDRFRGKQMIKTRLGKVPGVYEETIKKEALTSALDGPLSKSYSPGKYVQDVKRPSASENSVQQQQGDVKLSLKDTSQTDTAALMRENRHLKEALEQVKAQFKLTRGHKISDKSIHVLAGRILKKAESEYSRQTLEENLTKIFDYLANAEEVAWDELTQMGTTMTRRILEQSKSIDRELYSLYDEVRDYLKGITITLSESQREEAIYLAGSYRDYSKMLGSAVKLRTSGGIMLDEAWRRLSEMAPWLFDDQMSDASQVAQLADIVEMMKPQYVNPYEQSMDEAAYDLFLRIYDTYFELPEVKTYADRQKEKMQLAKQKFAHQLHQAREKAKAEARARKEDAEQAELLRRWLTAKDQHKLDQVRREADDEIREERLKEREKRRALVNRHQTEIAQMRTKAREKREKLAQTQARQKLRKRIERTGRELADWIQRPDEKKNHVIPESLNKTVLGLLEAIDLTGKKGKSTNRAADWAARLQQVRTAIARLDGMTAVGSDRTSLEFDFDEGDLQRMDELISRYSGGGTALIDMDAQALRELELVLTTLRHNIIQANMTRSQNHYKTISEAAAATINDLSGRKTKQPRSGLAGAADKLLNVSQLDSFAFFEELGPAAQRMFQPLREALDVKTRRLHEAQEYVARAATGVDLKAISGNGATVHTFKTSGGEIRLTTGQVMELYLLNKREAARRHIYGLGIHPVTTTVKSRFGKKSVLYSTEPVKVTAADVAKMTAVLSEKQKKLADALQRFLAVNCAAWGNETSVKLNGYRKFTDAAYYPIKSDPNFLAAQQQEKNNNAMLYHIRNMGFTKKLEEKANNAIMVGDILTTFADHVDDMSTYNAFAAPISDLIKWFNYKGVTETGQPYSVRQTIDRVTGEKTGSDYILRLIKDINGMTTADNELDLVASLTRNAKVASVGANIRVVLQQPTAYFRALAMLDPKYLTGAAFKRSDLELAMQYAPICRWKSWGFYEVSAGRSMRQIIVGDTTVAESLREKAMWLAGKADEMTWGTLWSACELETMDKRKDLKPGTEAFYKAVGQRMSEVVDRTQVVDSVFHRSQLMRSKNGMVGMYTAFMAEPTKSYNMLRGALISLKADRKNKENWKKTARTAAAFTFSTLATAMAAAVSDAFRDDEDEDPETGEVRSWAKKWLDAAQENFAEGMNPLNMIPVFKELTSMLEGYDASRMDLQGIEKLITAADNAWKYLHGEGKYNGYKVLYDLTGALSSVLGIPLGNIWRDLHSTADVLLPEGVNIYSETATAQIAYSNLYEAILKGDSAAQQRIRRKLQSGASPKTTATIDRGVAQVMADRDERIAQAWQVKEQLQTAQAEEIIRQLMAEGFTRDTVNAAIARYEAQQEGMEQETVFEDKALTQSLYTYDDLAAAVQAADEDAISDMTQSIRGYSTAQDPDKAIKTGLTKMIKPVYVDLVLSGDYQQANKLKNTLITQFGYESKAIEKWLDED